MSAKIKPLPWDAPEVKKAGRDLRAKIRRRQRKTPRDSDLDTIRKESRKRYEKLRDNNWTAKYRELCANLESKSNSKICE